MLLSNLKNPPGFRITKHVGLVIGNTIRAKHIGTDIVAGLKNVVGGEITGYTELLSESRNQAIKRMANSAKRAGANGIVNVRLGTAMLMGGAAELYAYGTAVVVEAEQADVAD